MRIESKIKQQGVTLLELILVMVIIVLILVAVGRYYETTRSSQRVNEGVRVINMISAAAEHWFMTYKSFNPPEINIEKLVNQGLLPDNFKPGANPNPNPWFGSISVSPVKNVTNEVDIQLGGLNKPECLSLCEIMNAGGMDSDCSANCQADSSNVGKVIYTATYSTLRAK